MKTELVFSSFDQTMLYMVKQNQVKPKGIVIIVHGLCEYSGRYDYVASKLFDAGYSVYRYDHRGHGRSAGKRTFFNSYLDISDDLNVVVDIVKEENPGKKIFIIGHSMGGHATACFGTRFPGKVDGLILAGALTRQSKDPAGAYPLNLPDDLYLENEFEEGICSDPEIGELYKNDPLVEKSISVGLLNRCWEGVQFLKKNAQDFTDPVLVLHGCCDGIISEQDSRDFYGEIASEDKTLKIYAYLFHEILNEPCKDEILKEVITWLNAHL